MMEAAAVNRFKLLGLAVLVGFGLGNFVQQGELRAQTVEEVVRSLEGLAPGARRVKLVEGAKREGRVVFYAATRASQSQALLGGFQRHYPFLKTDSYRASGFRLVNKILTEARAKRYEPDVIESGGHSGRQLIKAGLITKYLSPERRYVRKEHMDKEGLWTGLMHIRVALGYNTGLVKKEDVPKSYHDLLDPKWEGKVSIDNQDEDILSALIDAWGEEKALAFFRGLVKNRVGIRRSRTLQAQLVIAGEFHIAAFLHGNTPAGLKRQGAPVEIVMLPPYISKVGASYLPKHAPHPHAAILLYDYFLSEEAQNIVAKKFGRGPVRLGIKGKYPELEREKYQVVSPEITEDRLRKIHDFFVKVLKVGG